jgi:hypothetical protein
MAQTSYKQKGRFKRPVDVTETDSAIESPAKRYSLIRPWIDLANWAPTIWVMQSPPSGLIHWIERQNETPSFPRTWLLTLAKTRVADSEVQPLNGLAMNVFHTLVNAASSLSARCRTTVAYQLRIDRGVVRMKQLAPFAAFASVVEGTEAKRVRRCPICNRLFYAVRISSKACSVRCNRTRRVRKHRENQAKYEQTRKEKQR